MNLNEVDIHYLIAAISVITSALVFYTIGVWGERLQKRLKFWHLVFFLLGLLADSVGISSQPCKRRDSVLWLLFLLRVEFRRRGNLCAGLQAADRFAGHLSELPLVEYCDGLLAAV